MKTTAIFLVSLMVVILACKDKNPTGPDGSPSDIIFPTDSISYSRHVQPLFNQACAMSGCHSAVEPNERVRLNNYQNLRFGANGLPMIVPGSPDQSELVFRIEGRTGTRMPLNLNPLNQNQINGIRTWIAEGAREN